MKIARLLIAAALTCAAPVLVLAQQPKDTAKKSFVLRGKVEEVNESGKTMTVNHQKVEGFMDAMTMPYKIAQPDAFKKVKVGDQIQATVYADDYTLYDIQIVPKK